MTSGATLRSVLDWGPDATGSTRAVALMRIGLSALAFIRFGPEIAPFVATGAGGLMIGIGFFTIAGAAFLGLRARLSIGCLGALILTLYALTQSGLGAVGWNHHHVYILGMACLLLSLTDCGRSYSWDRWRQLDTAEGPPPEHGALWGQRLIALQMSALYFWTAIDKTDMAFLSGQRLEQIFVWSYSGRALEILLAFPLLLAAMSIAVVVVEYFLAVAILTRRYLKPALVLGLSMHALFYLMLPVSTYSATMMLLYLALVDPEDVRRFTDRMQTS